MRTGIVGCGRDWLPAAGLALPIVAVFATEAEVSPDLLTWQAGPGFADIVSDTTANGTRTLVFRDAVPVTTAIERYIRLRVSRP